MEKLKKGIVSVFIANFINMIISILSNFVLPKFLSIDTYSYIKTYQLYIGMIGILHLGYVDGMFLKYGGKELIDINMKDLNKNLSTFRIFQILITIIVIAFAVLFTHEYVYLAISLVIVPLNMASYFKSLYQSIGEFKRYSRLMNTTTVVTFIANFALLFGIKTDKYEWYLTSYVVINFVIWIILEVYFEKSCRYKFKILIFSFKEFLNNIKDGILLMLGNFGNSLLSSIDRWFVKGLLDSNAFAQYSFACSMETMVNVAVTPITVTLYNYFCKNPSKHNIIVIRNSLIILAAFLIACAFPAKFILEVYLTQYLSSSKILFCLFGAQLFYIVIKSVYVNLYKAMHQQKKYFVKLVSVIIIGIILNIICFYIVHTKEAFAIGTLLSAAIWFIFSVYDFKEYSLGFKPVIYIIMCLTIFLICGYTLNAILGFLVYMILSFLFTMLFLRKEFKYLVHYGKNLFHIHRKTKL